MAKLNLSNNLNDHNSFEDYEDIRDIIDDLYRYNAPDLYIIYKLNVIPKVRKKRQLEIEVEQIEEKLQEIAEELKTASREYQGLEAMLQPWERQKPMSKLDISFGRRKSHQHRQSDHNSDANSESKHQQNRVEFHKKKGKDSKGKDGQGEWHRNFYFHIKNWRYFFNKVFDWLIKAGLAFVIYFSLLEIVHKLGEVERGLKIKAPLREILCGISAVSLIWITSSMIYNAVLSESEHYKLPKYFKDYQFIKNSELQQQKTYKGYWQVYVSMIGVGVLEFFIGLGLIFLISAGSLNSLSLLQQIAMTVSIAIFSIVNMLHAFYKGRKDHQNKPIKYDIAFLLETIFQLEEQREELKQVRRKKLKKIAKIEQEIDVFQNDYFARRINDEFTNNDVIRNHHNSKSNQPNSNNPLDSI